MRFLRSPFVWIGLAITVAALILAFRGLHWGEVGHSIAGANYVLLSLAVVVLLLAMYARALRWRLLFYPRVGLRTWHLFGAINVGYALNNVLPLRVGELGRVYLICETEDVSGGRALSTVIVERALDTFSVVVLLLATLPFIDAPAWTRGPGLILLSAGFLALAALLALLSAAQDTVMRLVRRITRVLPASFAARIEETAKTGLQGFGVLRRPAVMVEAAGWSAAAWLLSALVTYIVMRAFALSLPFTAAMFVTSAIALGMVVPSSPGYVGVFHAIAIESLVKVFDVDRSDAASFAFAQHAILYLTPIAVSVGYVIRERETWQGLRRWTPSATAGSIERMPSKLKD